MSESPGSPQQDPDREVRARWLSTSLHALLLAAVLGFIGFRVYGYFATSETELGARTRKVQDLDVRQLRETANEAFEQENWTLAAETYGRIAELNPSSTRNRIRLAYSLHAAGQHDAALLEFLYLCRYEGNLRRWALYNAACIYAIKGEQRLALDYLQSAVSEGFRPRSPIQDDEDFASLKDNAEFLRLAELAKPYAQRELYRRFDFLAGQWTLVRDNDAQQGSLVVEKGQEGSSIRGQYQDATLSMLWSLLGFVDPADNRWHHVWLDNHGGVMQLQGGQEESQSHHLQGSYHASNASVQLALARAVYTSRDDGTVQIELATSRDEGTTWQPLIQGTLVPNQLDESGDEEGKRE